MVETASALPTMRMAAGMEVHTDREGMVAADTVVHTEEGKRARMALEGMEGEDKAVNTTVRRTVVLAVDTPVVVAPPADGREQEE